MNNNMTINEIVRSTMSNKGDCGRVGRAVEVLLRARLNGAKEFAHDRNEKDCSMRFYSVEIKTNCGTWFDNAFATKDEAEAYIAGGVHLPCRYVAYGIVREPEDYTTLRIYTEREFVRIFEQFGLFYAKCKNGEDYSVGVKNFIPTPKFGASKKRFAAIKEALASSGKSLEEWEAAHQKVIQKAQAWVASK